MHLPVSWGFIFIRLNTLGYGRYTISYWFNLDYRSVANYEVLLKA